MVDGHKSATQRRKEAKAQRNNGKPPTEDRPAFDFDDLCWGDVEDVTVLNAQLAKAQEINDADQIREILTAIRAITARIVRYVPRDWFVNRAPEPLDFSDPDTYRYLKRDKFQELQKMAKEEQSPLDSSGK